MTVTVRDFRDDDAPAVAGARRSAFPHLVETARKVVWTAATAPAERRYRLLVAELDGRVVGSAEAEVFADSERPGQAGLNVSVHSAALGRGAGAALVAAGEEYLAGVGATTAYAWALGVERSVGFAERRGYRRSRSSRIQRLDLARAALPWPPDGGWPGAGAPPECGGLPGAGAPEDTGHAAEGGQAVDGAPPGAGRSPEAGRWPEVGEPAGAGAQPAAASAPDPGPGAPAARPRVELRTLLDLADDPRPLYEVDVACLADEPGDVTEGPVPYGQWLAGTWHDPTLDRALSTVVLVDGVIAAYSLARTDGRGRYGSGMTGTRRSFRGRGLARLAKTASLRRARAAGYAVAYTGNDGGNAPMLAVNARLGYALAVTEWRYVRELGR